MNISLSIIFLFCRLLLLAHAQVICCLLPAACCLARKWRPTCLSVTRLPVRSTSHVPEYPAKRKSGEPRLGGTTKYPSLNVRGPVTSLLFWCTLASTIGSKSPPCLPSFLGPESLHNDDVHSNSHHVDSGLVPVAPHFRCRRFQNPHQLRRGMPAFISGIGIVPV